MMKMMKGLLLACVVACAAGAFAGALDTLISFSTPGPDAYGDGRPVIDGEWYALVWSQDGNFDGIKTDGTPVDAQDQVVMMAKLAKGGHCPFTVFQIDSAVAKSTGTYAVYLLDTRDPSKAAVAGAGANGKPLFLNGAQVVGSYSAGAATGSTAQAAAGGWAASEVAAAAGAQAKITAFKVEGARVSLTVSGMIPGVQYNVLMGETVDTLTSYALDVPKTVVDNDAMFSLDAKDAKFFTIVREPLAK